MLKLQWAEPHLLVSIYQSTAHLDWWTSGGGRQNCPSLSTYETPMEQNLKLEPAQEMNEKIKYRNLIGALLYISSRTRLDVRYSVNYLSRFQNCYDETHYKYVLRQSYTYIGLSDQNYLKK